MNTPLINGFTPKTTEPIDSRLVLSKDEMLNIDDDIMPAVYMAIESSTGALYVYNKNNSVDPDTGKFRCYLNVSS